MTIHLFYFHANRG
nr:acetyl-CoA carboxylase beta subunit [Bougainvillea spectabilis]